MLLQALFLVLPNQGRAAAVSGRENDRLILRITALNFLLWQSEHVLVSYTRTLGQRTSIAFSQYTSHRHDNCQAVLEINLTIRKKFEIRLRRLLRL